MEMNGKAEAVRKYLRFTKRPVTADGYLEKRSAPFRVPDSGTGLYFIGTERWTFVDLTRNEALAEGLGQSDRSVLHFSAVLFVTGRHLLEVRPPQSAASFVTATFRSPTSGSLP